MKKIGQLVSAMIAQNILVIILVGVIREIFGVYGWWYNHQILLLVNPIYDTLLPVLIAYTGGRLLSGQRGGVVASMLTFSLTLASSAPAILGAMVIGPLAGWFVKCTDDHIKKKLPITGYELLISNIILAIPTIVLSIVCFLYIGQVFSSGVEWTILLIENIIYSPYLPLASFIIEPAKVFFFNNILNYGVFGTLGIHQAKELGKSIFFLLEANPGPGLGVLLAYWMKTKGDRKKGAKLASFIHFLGGIHEVYFSYVLLNPKLLISVMLGGMTGVYFFQQFYVGLTSIVSPGSIFFVIGLAPREDMLYIVIGVLMSTLVSFLISIFLVKDSVYSPSASDSKSALFGFNKLQTMDRILLNEDDNTDPIMREKASITPQRSIRKIVFVCEAGLGSSAMGARLLHKKLKEAQLDIEVENAAINEIPAGTDVIICHQQLEKEVKSQTYGIKIISLQSFTDKKAYDQIIQKIQVQK
ncbi:PTS transporter subunit EIIC [Gracilibacillus suaedae]|uniref:PTS transporter subunit EIIC n=1 Tax=Gracilibacillus suaedae TaxID=2820273 RepID=UPI001ABDC777|nr:PTS transporter subunit EIIC [Gracilibacillus suaedae]